MPWLNSVPGLLVPNLEMEKRHDLEIRLPSWWKVTGCTFNGRRARTAAKAFSGPTSRGALFRALGAMPNQAIMVAYGLEKENSD